MGILNKRSISINGRKTGIFVESSFWNGLKDIAKAKKLTLSKLVEEIDRNQGLHNRSSSIRVFVLEYYRNAANLARSRE